MPGNIHVSKSSVRQTWKKDMYFSKLSTKFVLSEEQKDSVHACRKNLAIFENDPVFLHRVISADESWIYGCDSETKSDSAECRPSGSQRPPTEYFLCKVSNQIHGGSFYGQTWSGAR